MMSQPLSTASEAVQTNETQGARTASWERLGILYVRIALGSAFLSRRRPFWSLGQVLKLGKLR